MTYLSTGDLNPSLCSGLNVLHTNINGIKSHLDDLRDLISELESPLPFIALSETRLVPDEHEFLGIPGFSAFFRTRLARNPGGGVALYFDSRLNCNERNDLQFDPCLSNMHFAENLWVEVSGLLEKT